MTGTHAVVRSGGLGVLGVALVVLLWQLVASTNALGGAVSAPTAVLDVFSAADTRGLLVDAARATAGEALQGFLWSLGAAVVVGIVATVVRPLRRGVDQLATIESAIPFVALAPVMIALFTRDQVPAAMGAATAYFPLYIAVVAGLDAISPPVDDLLTVLGASRRATLVFARVPAGLPVIATGLKVGMPLAIVGAIIGEWFGASQGVGPIMLAAMRGYQMPTLWAAVTATVVVALLLYAVCSLVERVAALRFG